MTNQKSKTKQPSKRSPVGSVFHAICKGIGTPVALACWSLFSSGAHAQLAEMAINPSDYQDANSFRDDYLCVSFLKKYQGLQTGLDLTEEALRKFATSEDDCKSTNERFETQSFSDYTEIPRVALNFDSVLYTAKRKLDRLLGSFSWTRINPGCGWGPGATSTIKRRRAFDDLKISEFPISVSRRARPVMEMVIRDDLHWSSVVLGLNPEHITGEFWLLNSCFEFTDTCIIDTVPKDATSHRVIGKEPTCLLFLQKGFGSEFRRLLKRVGIDLDDQAANQYGARRALTDKLCTIDLKRASDSTARSLVWALFPFDWASALDLVRSHKAFVKGQSVELEKFSSMGNGFTFELESLIFWAICSAVQDLQNEERKEILVYGDDIIVPQSVAQATIWALGMAGFTTNASKTFVSGLFFESCGRHYFDGLDVTPIYQKEEVSDVQTSTRMANRVLRCAQRRGRSGDLDGRLSKAWSAALREHRKIAGVLETYLPLGVEGDDGLLLPASHFPRAHLDVNLGVKCAVLSETSIALPGIEAALYANFLRSSARGSHDRLGLFGTHKELKDDPCYGDVTCRVLTREGNPVLHVASRYVWPCGNFGAEFR